MNRTVTATVVFTDIGLPIESVILWHMYIHTHMAPTHTYTPANTVLFREPTIYIYIGCRLAGMALTVYAGMRRSGMNNSTLEWCS